MVGSELLNITKTRETDLMTSNKKNLRFRRLIVKVDPHHKFYWIINNSNTSTRTRHLAKQFAKKHNSRNGFQFKISNPSPQQDQTPAAKIFGENLSEIIGYTKKQITQGDQAGTSLVNDSLKSEHEELVLISKIFHLLSGFAISSNSKDQTETHLYFEISKILEKKKRVL